MSVTLCHSECQRRIFRCGYRLAKDSSLHCVQNSHATALHHSKRIQRLYNMCIAGVNAYAWQKFECHCHDEVVSEFENTPVQHRHFSIVTLCNRDASIPFDRLREETSGN